ncbi:hypothetical protein BV25DRAFT_1823180 [Artomyces pyxidatus]|uniref:Uncharacterized protein n=1 Tax=Artomyces pyxidatus TaxID=48021 RepID=A0ACB8T7U3_9AGAM|nr:hypothetical protein BV25DRAFT_1823180 [Artomyces pyxidatus]
MASESILPRHNDSGPVYGTNLHEYDAVLAQAGADVLFLSPPFGHCVRERYLVNNTRQRRPQVVEHLAFELVAVEEHGLRSAASIPLACDRSRDTSRVVVQHLQDYRFSPWTSYVNSPHPTRDDRVKVVHHWFVFMSGDPSTLASLFPRHSQGTSCERLGCSVGSECLERYVDDDVVDAPRVKILQVADMDR